LCKPCQTEHPKISLMLYLIITILQYICILLFVFFLFSIFVSSFLSEIHRKVLDRCVDVIWGENVCQLAVYNTYTAQIEYASP
jgi:hypothetical protein